MNRSKLLLVLFITIFQIGITAYSQKVSNISFRQEQSNIIVSYDLETKTRCKVNLYVSTNGGDTWQGPLTKITGDVGDKITSGNNSITWNVLEEFEELRGDKIMFQVRAIGDNIKTVKIGAQEWTVKNLDVSAYRNGDIIPEVKDPNEWVKLTTGAWCHYNNDSKNDKVYGKLYNWYAVNDPRRIAPKGFHIPTNAEWDILNSLLGGESVAGNSLKETGTLHWLSPNIDSTNSRGFFGLPGGFRGYFGTFYGIGSFCNWWSSKKDDATHAWYLTLNYSSSNRKISEMTYGFSIRCLRD